MSVLNIAHRGGAALWPENSLPAFAGALAHGYDGAELDVQLTGDGVAVVHHDGCLMADVARKDGRWLLEPGPALKDLRFDQLRQFDVGMPRPGSDYDADHRLVKPVAALVPTLEEVVALAAAAARRFFLFVELKSSTGDLAAAQALADAAYEVIAGHAFLEGTIFVGFDWRGLARIRQRAPFAHCWFSTDKLTGAAAPVIDLLARAGAEGWFAHHCDATAQNLDHARRAGLKIGAWTVNRQDDMRRLMDLDALCTDRPDLLAALQ